MKSIGLGVAALFLAVQFPVLEAQAGYGQRLCSTNPNYDCVKVRQGQSWESLFPNAQQRDLVKRVNRMNVHLQAGMVIAVPDNLARHNMMTVSPFPHNIGYQGTKVIIFDPNKLAWGAYDSNGDLVRWGPAAGGKNYCADVGRSCRTISGTYRIYTKKGAECKSSKYPLGKGGAPMPHCMFFHKGFALHGSPVVPGYHASHGCVRVYNEDAYWLNREFVEVGSTKVIVKPYYRTS